jgi:16S rRNA C967 or C1407 C5-methylase (RsmB/RsmF family)
VGKRSASGLVNAVLRAISRSRSALPLPPRPAAPTDREVALEYFAVTLSHPRWLAARWYDRFGFDAAERWLMFNNAPAPLTLRTN